MILQRSIIHPKSYPTLTNPNESNLINGSGSSNNNIEDHMGRHISNPEKDSLISYGTEQSNLTNIAWIGYSTKLPGHTIVNIPTWYPVPTKNNLKGQIYNTAPEGNSSQISKLQHYLVTCLNSWWGTPPKGTEFNKNFQEKGKHY